MAPWLLFMTVSRGSLVQDIFGEWPYTFLDGISTKYVPADNCNKSLLKILDDFSLQFNLSQIVNKPTHTNGNILDFLLTNNTDMIFDYQSTPTIYLDHFNIEVVTHLSFNKTINIDTEKIFNNEFDKFNFYSNKIDWENINKT